MHRSRLLLSVWVLFACPACGTVGRTPTNAGTSSGGGSAATSGGTTDPGERWVGAQPMGGLVVETAPRRTTAPTGAGRPTPPPPPPPLQSPQAPPAPAASPPAEPPALPPAPPVAWRTTRPASPYPVAIDSGHERIPPPPPPPTLRRTPPLPPPPGSALTWRPAGPREPLPAPAIELGPAHLPLASGPSAVDPAVRAPLAPGPSIGPEPRRVDHVPTQPAATRVVGAHPIEPRPIEYVQWPEGQRDPSAPKSESASLEPPPSGVLPPPLVRRR